MESPIINLEQTSRATTLIRVEIINLVLRSPIGLNSYSPSPPCLGVLSHPTRSKKKAWWVGVCIFA